MTIPAPTIKEEEETIDITSPSIINRSIYQALLNANNVSHNHMSHVSHGRDVMPFTIQLDGMFSEDKAQRKLLLDASLLPSFNEGKGRIVQNMKLFARRIISAHNINQSLIHADQASYASSALQTDIRRVQADLNDLVARFSMLHSFLLKTCLDTAIFALSHSSQSTSSTSSTSVQRPKIRGVRRLRDKDKVMNDPPSRRADRSKAEREVFKPDSITVLVDWFKIHITSPYPTDDEKLTLCDQTGLTRAQLQAWFVNARGRRWKKLLEETKQEAASGHYTSTTHASKSPTSKKSHKTTSKSSKKVEHITSSDSNDSESEYEEKPSTRNRSKRERQSKHQSRKRRRTIAVKPETVEQDEQPEDLNARTQQIVHTSAVTRRSSMNAGILEQMRLMPGLEPAESIGSVSSSYSSINHAIDRSLSRRFSNSVNLSIIVHGNGLTGSNFPHVDVLESPTMGGFNEFAACHQFGVTQSFATFNTTQAMRTIQKTTSFTVSQSHPIDVTSGQNGQNSDWKIWSPIVSGRGFPLSLDEVRGQALPIIAPDWRSQA